MNKRFLFYRDPGGFQWLDKSHWFYLHWSQHDRMYRFLLCLGRFTVSFENK